MTAPVRAEIESVEEWARAYVLSEDLRVKIAPPKVPAVWRAEPSPLRLSQPGRPPELVPARRGARTPKPEALRDPHCRARLLHTFWHHELQAAELMCWALLVFADAEAEFRQGLLRICLDEIRHMRAYAEHIEQLGSSIGAFRVRDWFWERVPSCTTKLSFVSLMGMGFEAANLEHAPQFAAQFRAVGDEQGAAVQEQIAKEERGHVRFATRWFARWTGGCDFDSWRNQLPPPLSPLVLRGRPIAREARLSAGMSPAFVAAIEHWEPDAPDTLSRGRQALSDEAS